MPQESRNRRNRSIRFAVFTSLISKGSSAALQFISLPLAAKVLGREEFGIYATISLSVFTVAILELGVGPALGRRISEANSRGDQKKQAQLFISGLVLVLGLALLGAMLAALVVSIVPLPVLFGQKYEPYVEIMRPALWLGIILMASQLVVEMTDRLREGYMEAGVVNAWATVGNFIGAIIIFAGVRYEPDVSFLLLAVFGPNIIARVASMVLLLRKRPWLIASRELPRRVTMIELIREGLSFTATSFVVYFVDYTVCALIVGRLSGPADVAVFHVLMSITTAFTGLLIMVGRPIWAAIADAKELNDHEWMHAVIFRYYKYLCALSLAASVFLIGIGPWLIPVLYGDEFLIGRPLFICHSVLLFAMGWRLVNRYIMIGLGLIPRTVVPILSGLTIGLVLGVAGLSMWGLWALFVGMATGALLFPGLWLSRIISRQLQGDKRPYSGPAMPEPKVS
ncbi:MAG: lipopolysaccharide biosynthesis protein [Verrucomicrobiales bacterium]|nr:lipopolysaccharide biosynthesis protein [Verrucomicrobiales bacterium]